MGVLSCRGPNTDVPVALLVRILRVPRQHPSVREAWELQKVGLRWDEEPIPAIYPIIDLKECDVYFGETSNAYRRKRAHNAQLRSQTHHNGLLQNACGGIDDQRWRLVVLQECSSRRQRLRAQAAWIAHVPTCINALNDKMARDFRAVRGR